MHAAVVFGSHHASFSVSPLVADEQPDGAGFLTGFGLSPAEAATVRILFGRPGVTMSWEAIRAAMPEWLTPSDERMIDVYICRARTKLARAGAAGAIVTVWGRGYMAAGRDSGNEPTPPVPRRSDIPALVAE